VLEALAARGERLPPELRIPSGAEAVELVWPGKQRGADTSEPQLRPVELFPGSPTAEDPANLLMSANNRVAMAALRTGWLAQHVVERAGIRLIYIDPPFAMQTDHRVDVTVDGGSSGPSIISTPAFRDTWGKDGSLYLQFMYERLLAMRGLLADDGAICVHCDWRANSWLRLLMDEVFGRDCFRNEIIWKRAPNLGRQAASKQLGRVVDTILLYSKTAGTAFRGSPPIRSQAVELDGNGKPRGVKWDPQRAYWFTTAPRGDYTDASIAQLRLEGRVYDSATGRIYIKYPLREGDDGAWYKDQPVDTLWTDPDVRPLRHCSKDELGIGYATQKPEGLLRRIIEWTTARGDLVADFFCGSGTTLAAAEKLGRRWIGCDNGALAVHTSRKRMAMVQAANRASGLAATGFAVLAEEHRVDAPPQPAQPEPAMVSVEADRTAASLKIILAGFTGNPLAAAGLQPAQRGAHWSSWVDGWAVDFAYGDRSSKVPGSSGSAGLFVSDWFTYRTRQNRALTLSSPAQDGEGLGDRIAVRVFDILGGVHTRIIKVPPAPAARTPA